MKERPILFNGSMVRAILEGRKTQTRRIVNHLLKFGRITEFGRSDTVGYDWHFRDKHMRWHDISHERLLEYCPYGQPGDRLGVRETFFAWGRWETRFSEKKGRDEWHFIDMTQEYGNDYLYAAAGVSDTQAFIKRRRSITPMYWKRPAIFMPRAASRITLEITGVRIERLQNISVEDCIAEGLKTFLREHDACTHLLDQYKALWALINGAESWDHNPWIWVIEF